MNIGDFVTTPGGILLIGVLGTILAELLLMLARAGFRRLPALRKRLFDLLIERGFRWFQHQFILFLVVVEDKRPFGAGIFFAYQLAKLNIFALTCGLAALVLHREFKVENAELSWLGVVVGGVVFIFAGWKAMAAFARIALAYFGYWVEREARSSKAKGGDGPSILAMLQEARSFKVRDLEQTGSTESEVPDPKPQ